MNGSSYFPRNINKRLWPCPLTFHLKHFLLFCFHYDITVVCITLTFLTLFSINQRGRKLLKSYLAVRPVSWNSRALTSGLSWRPCRHNWPRPTVGWEPWRELMVMVYTHTKYFLLVCFNKLFLRLQVGRKRHLKRTMIHNSHSVTSQDWPLSFSEIKALRKKS